MNNKDLDVLIEEGEKILKENGLDKDSINQYRSGIKQISIEESNELGKQLFEIISQKDYRDDTSKIEQLLLDGANPNYQDTAKGEFCLRRCARKKYVKTFILLLKAGANINLANNFGTTSIITAARFGSDKILDIGIHMGGDVNARPLDGDTAIMGAKNHSNIKCFDLLAASHAHLNTTNLSNKTIFDSSRDSSFFERSTYSTELLEQSLDTEEDSLLEKKLMEEAIEKMTRIIEDVDMIKPPKQMIKIDN